MQNNVDTVIYSTERLLKDADDKTKYPNGIPEDLKKKVTDKLEELKKAREVNNIDDMKKKLEEMNEVVQEVGKSMYAQSQAQNSAQNPNPNETQTNQEAPKQDGPVEGEYEEVKKE